MCAIRRSMTRSARNWRWRGRACWGGPNPRVLWGGARGGGLFRGVGLPLLRSCWAGSGIDPPSLFGSDIHVMLALRRRSRQVVVTNEQFNGPDMVGELLGKGQRSADQS